MKRITYLIGAGASCKSQPLVSNMKERMHLLLQMLTSTSICNNLFDVELQRKTNKLFSKYKSIIYESFNHYTPDTYAKKLWLNKKYDTLAVFKEFLNLYFIFEQQFMLGSTAKINLNSSNMGDEIYKTAFKIDTNSTFMDINWNNNRSNEKYEINKALFFKSLFTNIDYRYDVFYATLLEARTGDKLTLPPNVNILSWNYDNQLELAYNAYENLDVRNIDNYLNINPSEYNQNKSHIIKLNGSCNRTYSDENEEVHELTFLKAIKLLLDNKEIHNKIYFAWENPSFERPKGTILNILKNTDELVIIGYSFPNFNREVDSEIFNNLKLYDYNLHKYCKITVQVPDKNEFLKIKDRIFALINETEISKDDLPVLHIDDTDQFYIPPLY